MNAETSNAAVSATFPDVIELNVGGVVYATTLKTLTREPDSMLGQLFSAAVSGVPLAVGYPTGDGLVKDNKGRYFVDRDGVLFRYVLDYLRNQKLVLPECFHERDRLRQESEYFRLPAMTARIVQRDSSLAPLQMLATSATDGPTVRTSSPLNSTGNVSPSTANGSAVQLGTGPPLSPSLLFPVPIGGYGTVSGREPGYVIVGYRGTFAFGRDGCQADVKFRKLWRILVSGRVSLCREVFRDTLNESRDVDRGTTDRYTARFFLKHTFIEQAFDMLLECGFRLVGTCGSGTNSAGEMKPGMDTEESKWNHYNEFVFCRI